MKMTVLRALRIAEMDVDLEHKTHVPTIEADELGNVTIYGMEAHGELYYVVIDKEVAEFISTIYQTEMPIKKPSPRELYDLGRAYSSFMHGDIDGGIYLLIPLRNVDTGVWKNIIFQDLIDEHFFEIDYPPGYMGELGPFVWPEEDLPELYTNAIEQWAVDNQVNIFETPRNTPVET